jgi:hypothetical protein
LVSAVKPGGKHGTLVGSTLGGYWLVALLGAGGMAEVYRGVDPRQGREVAVKVLPLTLAADPGYVARFRDEARRVAALNHPNVVPVFRYGEERGLLYLVMPVLTESLRDRMDRQRRLEPAAAAQIAIQIAGALDAAHQHGLVHRDVKPENILLTPDGRALLTDFGIAREVDALRDATMSRTLAATGLPVGTPEYMAPEQLRGGSADQRVDIYGLGAVLYEMLTGRVPHDADTPYEVAARVLNDRVLPPSEYNPAIWPALEDVVLGALARDADDRYPDTRSFARALDRAVARHTPRGAGAVSGPVGSGAPTPLARSLSKKRLSGGHTGELDEATAAPETERRRGRGRSRRRKPLLVLFAAVMVLVGFLVGGAVAISQVTDLSNLSLLTALGSTTTTRLGPNGPAVAPTATTQPTATAQATPSATPGATTTPSVSVGYPTVALAGAPPHPCTGTQTLVNNGAGSIIWSLAPPPTASGLTFSPRSGTLAPGNGTTIVITYTGADCAGQTATITVSASGGGTAQFTLNY